MEKKHRNIAIILVAVLTVSVLAIQFVPFDPYNGVPPDPPPNIGVPVLDDISKTLVIKYTLEWEFSTSYVIDGYLIYKRINESSWLVINYVHTRSYDVWIAGAGLYEFKIVGVISYDGNQFYSADSNIKSVAIIPEYTTPILQPIIPYPNTDGIINLEWCEVVGFFTGYRVYKYTDPIWTMIAELSKGTTTYTDTVEVNGTYTYYVILYCTLLSDIVFNPSNQESITVEIFIKPPPVPVLIYPTNPSIEIDGGAETTDSLTVTLTLYCNDAEQMQLQLDEGVWLDWTNYETTHTLILQEGYLKYGNTFIIVVVFRNENGTSEDAGYYDIYDDITYETTDDDDDDLPPIPPNGDDEADDYTLIYILIAVLIGLIGIGVFLRYRYKNRKQIIKSKFK